MKKLCIISTEKRKTIVLRILCFFLILLFTENTIKSYAQEIRLFSSWYSIESLKKEGTWKRTKGVCADGSYFRDDRLTAATRLYPLGTRLRVINLANNKSVEVIVTDRISKRFAKTRIDLSQLAFSRIAKLETGIISVKAEVTYARR